MNDDTVIELNRLLESWRAGSLDADDEAYLRALHGRLMNIEAEPVESTPSAPNRLDGLTIEEWRERALRAESELAQFQDAARSG